MSNPAAASTSTTAKRAVKPKSVAPLQQLRHLAETAAMTPANDTTNASTSRLAYVGNAPKGNEKFVRKTREQLNTGNARPAVRDRLPVVYDALEKDAPLRREFDYITAEFKHDDFIKGRQVRTQYLHNDKEREVFDAENFDLLPINAKNTKYLDKVETRRLGADAGYDPALEAELQAAFVVPTADEWTQWKADVHNPAFAKSIKANAIRGSKKLTEVERAQQLNDAKSRKEKLMTIKTAFLHHRDTTKENPDFYTGFSDFDLARKRADAKKAAAIKELNRKDDDDDGDADAVEEKEDDDERGVAEHENAPVPVSNEDARQLLECNPLKRLQRLLHKDFMALAEVMMTWQLLFPLLIQLESKRKHYNAIELIRAMNMCGAKYDGCVVLAASARLGNLVSEEFYAGTINVGRFAGGHEHYWSEKQTRMAVFKFYIVERNKENTNALSKYGLDDDNETNLMNTDAYDPNQMIRKDEAQKRLNKPGLYDQDNVEDQADDVDARSIYSSMHNIKDLAAAFMFCVRVVCVVPESGCGDDESAEEALFISEEDDDLVLPEDEAAVRAAVTGSIDLSGHAHDDDVLTVGPEDNFALQSEHGSPRRAQSSLRRLDDLQQSVFDDGDDAHANDVESSEPREIIVSDNTQHTTTTTSQNRSVVTATSSSRLFGHGAGSNSIDEDDDNDDDDDLDFNARTSKTVLKRVRRLDDNVAAPLSPYRNTERYGVRFEDIDDANLLTEDMQAQQQQHQAHDDDDGASFDLHSHTRKTTEPAVDKFDIHTDDEAQEGVLENSDDSSANDFRPDKQIMLTLEEAKNLVGEWKGADLMKKINSRYLTKLCVRAFAYYAVSRPITTSQVGSGGDKRKSKSKKKK